MFLIDVVLMTSLEETAHRATNRDADVTPSLVPLHMPRSVSDTSRQVEESSCKEPSEQDSIEAHGIPVKGGYSPHVPESTNPLRIGTVCLLFRKGVGLPPEYCPKAMNHYVYILCSGKDGDFYTGYSNNLQKRIKEHRQGKVFSTQRRLPMRLMYYEACGNEHDARAREWYLKSGMGKRYLRNRLKRQLQEKNSTGSPR
ncbi:MAG: GIY-YIG nuclease family protein [bacterium]